MKNIEIIISEYERTGSLKETSRITGISPQSVRRILLNPGKWSSPRAEKINMLYEQGLSIDQIAEQLGLRKNTVSAYLPWTKGSFLIKPPTENALKIRAYRKRKSLKKKKGMDKI